MLSAIGERRLVGDLPRSLVLVQDSQEVSQILDFVPPANLALTGERDEFACLLVETGEGDYSEIWGIMSYVPCNHNGAYRLL